MKQCSESCVAVWQFQNKQISMALNEYFAALMSDVILSIGLFLISVFVV